LGESQTKIRFQPTFCHNSGSWAMALYLLAGVLIIIGLFFGFYRVTSRFYHKISRMYPFTIILLSLFVATLFTDGKPINQNKSQYLAINLYTSSTEDHSYTADVEYPLIKRPGNKDVIGKYFDLKEEKPNIVFLMVEGLGRAVLGKLSEQYG